MPELPEVETVVRGLKALVTDCTIEDVETSGKKLRIPYPLDLAFILKNKRITSVRRWAKYIVIYTDSMHKIVMHLGMSGRLTIHNSKDPKNKHDHVIFYLSNSQKLTFNDARRFGLVTVTDCQDLRDFKFFSHLGPDPLEGDFSFEYFYNVMRMSKSCIKALLMKSQFVVGVGNIYASESLFAAGILPNRIAYSLSKKEAMHLYVAIKEVLQQAIKCGGSSLKDYVHADGSVGNYQNSFKVYGREQKSCDKCGNIIQKMLIAGRSSFYCSNCQK